LRQVQKKLKAMRTGRIKELAGTIQYS
jgi:hypothetical protein